MKILLYHWKAYSDQFLEYNLRAMGHEVKLWSDDTIMYDQDTALPDLGTELKKGYDIVFSFNYFKIVAMVCHIEGIPYIAWTQDSPLLSLYDNSTCLDTNYFFCFDYEQYEGMKNRGISNAFYCPLATDVEFMRRTADSYSEEELRKYKAQISFVGSLYTERNMWSGMSGMPEYLKGFFDGIVESQLRIPIIRFSQMQFPTDIITRIRQILDFEGGEESCISYEELIDNLIDRQVTVIERGKLISLLAEKPGFKLYTHSDTSAYSKVNNCGSVDYYVEMPKVFRNSDININTTLRSIRSGIPLRILDIIASGGFVLTNAQPELNLYFEEGESIATFFDLNEMEDKIDYYLAHESERRKIIENGYQIVKEQFDIKYRLLQIFETVGIPIK